MMHLIVRLHGFNETHSHIGLSLCHPVTLTLSITVTWLQHTGSTTLLMHYEIEGLHTELDPRDVGELDVWENTTNTDEHESWMNFSSQIDWLSYMEDCVTTNGSMIEWMNKCAKNDLNSRGMSEWGFWNNIYQIKMGDFPKTDIHGLTLTCKTTIPHKHGFHYCMKDWPTTS